MANSRGASGKKGGGGGGETPQGVKESSWGGDLYLPFLGLLWVKRKATVIF